MMLGVSTALLVVAQVTPWFEDSFTSLAESQSKWDGFGTNKAEIWNNLMIQSGNEVFAVTKGTLREVQSQITEPNGMGGMFTIHASFNAHPDHLTDDDAMIMICHHNQASAAWAGENGCAKFLLWDEGPHYWKRVLTDSVEDMYPYPSELRQTQCGMTDVVRVSIEVNLTRQLYGQHRGVPNITVAYRSRTTRGTCTSRRTTTSRTGSRGQRLRRQARRQHRPRRHLLRRAGRATICGSTNSIRRSARRSRAPR